MGNNLFCCEQKEQQIEGKNEVVLGVKKNGENIENIQDPKVEPAHWDDINNNNIGQEQNSQELLIIQNNLLVTKYYYQGASSLQINPHTSSSSTLNQDDANNKNFEQEKNSQRLQNKLLVTKPKYKSTFSVVYQINPNEQIRHQHFDINKTLKRKY